MLALMGDSVDNVEGVPGIGEKGAKDLISSYGSLDDLLARADEVPQKKYREGLKAHADDARQSRELVKLRTDVEIGFYPEAFKYAARRAKVLPAVFATRIQDAGHRICADRLVDRKGLRGGDAVEALDVLIGELRAAGRFALRIVADGPSCVRATLIGLVFSTAPRAGALRAARAPGLRRRQHARSAGHARIGCKPVLEDPPILKVGHDLKADVVVLARHGIALAGLDIDTMLASYLIDATKSSEALEPTVLEQLGYKALTQDEVCGKGTQGDALRAGAGRRPARLCR